MMRPKETAKDLPFRMLRRTKRLKNGDVWVGYYYNGRDDKGRRKEIPLGSDLNEAKRKWAELECKPAPAETGLMSHVFGRYERDILETKSPRTQKDNRDSLRQLRPFFDSAPIEAVTPQLIAQYRDKRSAKVRANREIALFSHVWNMAREWGYTAKENPVKGVRKNKETPRDFYADDAVWAAVYAEACVELQFAMDLDYLTGQRPADVLKMKFSDIKDGALEVQQNKTKKRLRILLESNGIKTELGKLVDRIRSRKVSGIYLVVSESGLRLSMSMLQERFADARTKAAGKCADKDLEDRIRKFQFRDIRPKAASETDLTHASKLLGHTDKQITQTVYRRVGEVVNPTR